MRERSRRSNGVLLPLGLFGVLYALACGSHRPPARASAAAIATAERTVFSDTALYRAQCVEADSGLTATSGRCTLRDQGRARGADKFSRPSERPAP